MSRNEATAGTIIENEEQLAEVTGGADQAVHITLRPVQPFNWKKFLEGLLAGRIQPPSGGVQPA